MTERGHERIAGTKEAEALGPIHVTRTFLPPREEYLHWLDQAYESHQLTNNGPIHKLLEETLRQRFQVPHLKLMANGTLALQLAIQALGVAHRGKGLFSTEALVEFAVQHPPRTDAWHGKRRGFLLLQLPWTHRTAPVPNATTTQA